MIYKSGKHLLELINDILDISKIEAGHVSLDIELISIQILCQESLQFIRKDAADKEIALKGSFDERVASFYGDQRRIKQILINLLSNAVKFTPNGGEVGLATIGQQDEITFEVWDTGIGIAADRMDQIFLPFIQLDSRLSRQYAGTGLGLALVERLTNISGGRIQVSSELGVGTRFSITLPKQPQGFQNAAGRIFSTDRTRSDAPLGLQAPIPNKPRILIVDDDPVVQEIFSDFLQSMGGCTTQAFNGLEALEQINLECPDIILMDIQMPRMDGLETMRRIREMPRAEKVPIIALTALAMTGDRDICLAAGADEYLSKPVTLQKLKTTIIQMLARNRK
jgi:CheY-like chemotaxis protein/anti-sigma regulatory factor (Ser/Thr protein kinase)